MNAAVIGTGYWGKKYVMTLVKMAGVNLSWVCSKTSSKFAPEETKFTRNYKEILSDKEVDCVIVSTPLETHFEIAQAALKAGKHVLLEKPFTSTSEEASRLLDLTDRPDGRLVLLAGHIYLHHQGIIKLKSLIYSGELGDIKTVFSKRMSSSKHPNSLWEMGAHDIYILDYLFDGYGQTIKNIMGNISHCMFDLEYSNRENVKSPYAYSDKPIHTINAYVEVCNDWNKTRIICINGSKKQAVFDDEANEDVKIVVRNNETREVQFIRIESQPSPLETQCKHFFDCITNRINPIANAFDGYKNISILQSVSNLLNTKL